RLESAAQGRFQFAGGTGDERFSPLLSTRPLSLDRDLHGQIAVSRTNPNRGTEVTGEISRESMALMTLSPRTKLTSVSGAVPIPPAGVAGIAGRRSSELTPDSLLSDINLAAPISDISSNARSAFGVYYGALAGELEVYRLRRASGQDGLPSGIVNAVWDVDLSDVRENPYSTLFYGHRGPELAMRVAAHAAVNAKDLYDTDSTPTVATLVLDNDSGTVRTPLDRFQNYVSNTPGFELDNANGSIALLYPGLNTLGTGLLDIDNGVERERRVLPEGQLPEGRRLVNVYGVEATPIITEVSMIHVYTDASESLSDVPSDSNSPPRQTRPGQVPIIDSADIEQITISSTRNETNPDLMMSVLAIQLTNPWDDDIVLGGGSGPLGTGSDQGRAMWRVRGDDDTERFDDRANLEFNYYIEYNGRFFKLGEFREYLEPLSNGGPDYTSDTEYTGGGGPAVDPDGQPIPVAEDDDSYVELEYRSVTLAAGESRVFYVTAHTRFDTQTPGGADPNAGLEKRWEDIVFANEPLDREYQDLTINTPNDNDLDLDGVPDGYDTRGWTGPMQEWLIGQFSPPRGRMGRPVRVHPFDPTTGELVEGEGTLRNPASFVDYANDPGDPAADLGLTGRVVPDDEVIRLWRKVVVSGAEEVPTSARSGSLRNFVQNDLLVDRLFTDSPSVDSFLASAAWSNPGGEITNSVSWSESFDVVDNPCDAPTGTVNLRNDNTGLTFARWASVRRKDTIDELAGSEVDPEENLGKIDAYLLSSRRNPAAMIEKIDNISQVPNSPDITNFYDFCDPTNPLDAYNGVEGSRAPLIDFVNYDAERFVFDFWEKGRTGSATPARVPVVATVSRHPRVKHSNVNLQASVEDIPGDRFDASPLGVRTSRAGLFADANGRDPLLPEIFVSTPMQFDEDQLEPLEVRRVADELRVMGIGPTYAPDEANNPRSGGVLNDHAVYDDEWMTLTEAFAIALGFEDFATAMTGADVTPDIVWWDSVKSYTALGTGDTEVEYVLDDLRLRLDDYVAFLNQNTGDETEKAFFTFDPSSPNTSDVRRGTGVPVALGVLDAVRVFDPVEYPSSPSTDNATA
ncbi:MAG: hypothetical protein AAGA55_10445, partial [Planctomycetota bacterium]